MLNSSIGKNKSVISENKFVAEIIDLFSELKIPPADAIVSTTSSLVTRMQLERS